MTNETVRIGFVIVPPFVEACEKDDYENCTRPGSEAALFMRIFKSLGFQRFSFHPTHFSEAAQSLRREGGVDTLLNTLSLRALRDESGLTFSPTLIQDGVLIFLRRASLASSTSSGMRSIFSPVTFRECQRRKGRTIGDISMPTWLTKKALMFFVSQVGIELSSPVVVTFRL